MSIKLTENALVCRVQVCGWTGERVDKNASKEVADNHHTRPKYAGKFVKNLLAQGKAQLKEVAKLASRCRQIAARHSLPWVADGFYLVPVSCWEQFNERMVKLSEEHQRAVDAFLSIYPGLIEQARQELNGLFNASDYPTVDELRGRFSFDIEWLPVPDGNDFDRLLALDDVADKMRARIDERNARALQDAESALVDRLAKCLTRFSDRLRGYEKGRISLSGPMELVETVAALNVSASGSIASACDKSRTAFNAFTEKQLRTSATNRQTVIECIDVILSLDLGVIPPAVMWRNRYAPETTAIEDDAPEVSEVAVDDCDAPEEQPTSAVDVDDVFAALGL